MKHGGPAAFGSAYRLISSAVIPRPIAWISSTSEDGVDNLAPFSFNNVVSYDPPILMVAPVGTGDDLKDTARNILDTGEYVHNLVTDDVAEAMNGSSALLDADESEFEHAGLTRAESEVVDVPRVEEAHLSMEMELYDHMEVGSSTMILGEVVYSHVDEEYLTEEDKIDATNIDATGRLAGGYYCRTRDRFHLERPYQ
jgi:flavin reductase (DIM6/NTAB) family NADH-FMN oxidoreductase RutF